MSDKLQNNKCNILLSAYLCYRTYQNEAVIKFLIQLVKIIVLHERE